MTHANAPCSAYTIAQARPTMSCILLVSNCSDVAERLDLDALGCFAQTSHLEAAALLVESCATAFVLSVYFKQSMGRV